MGESHNETCKKDLGRVIEIANNHRYLHAYRGFMVIEDSQNNEVLGKVPIEDVSAVIAHGYQITYSNELLVRLAERSIPLALNDSHHAPVGALISLAGNIDQAKRFDAQIAASAPTRKRMWAEVVRAKVKQQATLLDSLDLRGKRLWDLSGKVKSGDPENIEAQAARIYWQRLLGSDFRRDRKQPGINSFLNYGYTVLRAATARSVVAAGLHPTIGIHHKNETNSFRLVDDLMEPFRPFIDHQVHLLANQGLTALEPEVKLELVQVLGHDLATDMGVTPITSALSTLAVSLAHVYLGERKTLELPSPQIAIDMQELNSRGN